MAYIKQERKGNHTYLRIVESQRDESGKVRKKTLLNLGNVSNISQTSLKKMGKVLYELGGGALPDDKLPDFRESARYNYGFCQIFGHILKEYELDKLFRRMSERRKLGFNLFQAILLMICERLNDPSSKLSNFNHQNEYIGLEPVSLHHLYRSLDYLYENQVKVQQLIFSRGRNLFNQKLDVVFYDVTTFYFDSEWEDGFRMKGFSKDGKIGNTVIVFGLLIDKDKNPIGYRIYEGGHYEGHTFEDAVRQLKKEYSIDRVITVADRGMMNRTNIDFIESDEIGYEYIIGERLKNLPQSLQSKILDRSKYQKHRIIDEDTGEEIELEYLTIEHNGRRIITTYSAKRAAKDRHSREEKIERGKLFMQMPSKIERKAAAHFIKKVRKNEYYLDEEAIAKSAAFDGLISIATNTKDLPENEILSAYKQLYKIEQTFRTFKSYIETRPMFHWTRKRIEGHLCLCYMSFTLLNYLGQKLTRAGTPLSEKRIRDAIENMQVSLVKIGQKEYYSRSNNGENVCKILKQLKIKDLPTIIEKDDIKNYISIT